MRREPWYESDNPSRLVRGVGWRAGVWVLAILAFSALIGGGVWLFKVATADIKGRGDTTIKINEVDNRLFAQGNFHDLYNEIKASDRKLTQAATDKADHPGDSYFVTVYTGLKAHCEDAVAQYNAAAQKINQAKFRDEQLPAQIDRSNPETDCQETK